jgi:dTDP-4-amino-4,6-dideoxygalactose transaminase
MNGEPIIFGKPWFGPTERRLVLETLESGWIGQGPLVERFEHALGGYLGAAEVVAVSSCTAALQLSLLATGIGEGDEVVTTPFGFVATVNAIDHTGAEVVLVDIDRDSLNMTPEEAATALTSRTRAIVPIAFGGRPFDTAGFRALAERHDLVIVEDAAHAIGAISEGRPIGGSGHRRTLTCFSFYPNKNLASADGGAIALADTGAADRLRKMRLHGLELDAWQRYQSDRLQPSLAVVDGHKSNWNDLQAAIALGQLELLEGFLAIREVLAQRYDALLSELRGVTPVDRGSDGLHERHALHLYQIWLDGDRDRRDRIVSDLRRRGIGAAVHYIAIHLHPYFRDRFSGPFVNSEEASNRLITLPLHPGMDEGDVERVVSALATSLKD